MIDFPYEAADCIELEPCPFCGHTQRTSSWEDRVHIEQSGMECYVVCGACKSRSLGVPLPVRAEEVDAVRDSVTDIFDLPDDYDRWELNHLWLFNALLAAKLWNNRRLPRGH